MNINPQQILLVDKIQHFIILKCKFVEITILGYTDHNFISMFDKLYSPTCDVIKRRVERNTNS